MDEPMRIQRIRESAGLTRTEFGEKLGISADHVGKLERGDKQASRNVLLKIVEVFPNVTIDYIVTGRLSHDPKSNGNNSFLVHEGSCETSLAKEMFRTMNKLANGIHAFDQIAVDLENLRNLETTVKKLSINPQLKTELNGVQHDKRISA